MEQKIINEKILNELKQIRIDIDIIKDNLNDEDSQLTEEEERLLKMQSELKV